MPRITDKAAATTPLASTDTLLGQQGGSDKQFLVPDLARYAPTESTIEFTSDANLTLTALQAQSSSINFTDSPSTLTAGRDVIFPANFLHVYVKNSTAQTLTMKKSGQTGIAITAGSNAILVSGATDVLRGTSTGAVDSVNGSTGAVIVLAPIVVACSDENSVLTVGTNKVKFRNPYAGVYTVTAVKASLSTAQASGSIFTVDINEAGSTILSTKITIDNTETTSTTAATAPVISDSSIAADAELSIDIDQVGDGTAKGLKVTILGYPS